MNFAKLPYSDQVRADRLFVLYRINSPVYKEAFYKLARHLAVRTGYINTLLIQMTNYQYINEDTDLIDFLIKECGATAINEMVQYTRSLKVIRHLRDKHGASNIIEKIGEIPVTEKTCGIHIWRITNGARIELYTQAQIRMILHEGGGIILNLHPRLLKTASALPFVDRHDGVRCELKKTCLNCVTGIVMDYVVYENI